MTNQPLVSIVITNYNREKTIAQAIESALAQDYHNLEIIISDNSSTDNSHNIISAYTADTRIKYFRNNENIGMLNNFKISFEERAKGDYITLVNSDDELINPQFISQCITLIQNNPNVVIVKSKHTVSQNGNNAIMDYSSYKAFYTGLDFLNSINFNIDFGWAGILLHRQKLNQINPFGLQINSADYVANFFLLLQGNICFNNSNSYKFYLHSDNASKLSFSLPQIQKLFPLLQQFFLQLQQKSNQQQFESIKENICLFFFKSIYQNNYLNNRRDIKPIAALLNNFDKDIFNKYLNQPQTRQFKLLFYYPKLGNWITHLKKLYLPTKK